MKCNLKTTNDNYEFDPQYLRMKKENRIAFRVTDLEKKRITVLAQKCGLSISEYVKQRALGYAPQPILPEAIFPLIEKIGQLQDLTASPETDAAICALLKEISDTLLLPRKEGISWPLPDSGL